MRALIYERYGTPDVLEVLGGPRTAGRIARATLPDLERIAAWCAEGALRPTLDRTFPLERGAEVVRAFGRHEARGKFAIVVAD